MPLPELATVPRGFLHSMLGAGEGESIVEHDHRADSTTIRERANAAAGMNAAVHDSRRVHPASCQEGPAEHDHQTHPIPRIRRATLFCFAPTAVANGWLALIRSGRRATWWALIPFHFFDSIQQRPKYPFLNFDNLVFGPSGILLQRVNEITNLVEGLFLCVGGGKADFDGGRGPFLIHHSSLSSSRAHPASCIKKAPARSGDLAAYFLLPRISGTGVGASSDSKKPAGRIQLLAVVHDLLPQERKKPVSEAAARLTTFCHVSLAGLQFDRLDQSFRIKGKMTGLASPFRLTRKTVASSTGGLTLTGEKPARRYFFLAVFFAGPATSTRPKWAAIASTTDSRTSCPVETHRGRANGTNGEEHGGDCQQHKQDDNDNPDRNAVGGHAAIFATAGSGGKRACSQGPHTNSSTYQ